MFTLCGLLCTGYSAFARANHHNDHITNVHLRVKTVSWKVANPKFHSEFIAKWRSTCDETSGSIHPPVYRRFCPSISLAEPAVSDCCYLRFVGIFILLLFEGLNSYPRVCVHLFWCLCWICSRLCRDTYAVNEKVLFQNVLFKYRKSRCCWTCVCFVFICNDFDIPKYSDRVHRSSTLGDTVPFLSTASCIMLGHH